MFKRIKYLGLLIKILINTDKKFLYTLIMQIVCLSLIPFIQIFMTSKSIEMFEKEIEYKTYFVTIFVIISIYLTIQLTNIFFDGVNETKANLIGQKMYAKIFETCLSIDYEKLQEKGIQEKKELATKAFDGASLANLTREFKVIVSSVIILCGVAGVIFNANIVLLTVSLAVIIIDFIIVFKIKNIQYDADKEIVPLIRKIDYYRELSSDFAVAKEARIYKFKDKIMSRYNKLYYQMVEIINKVVRSRRQGVQAAELGNVLLEYLIYFILGYQLLVGKEIMISEFTAIAVSVRTFNLSMGYMINSFSEVDKNAMHLRDYFEFINLKPNMTNDGYRITDKQINIEFRNVSFKYPGSENYVLKNLNLRINNKERISVVGENGSGKTTFVKLLMRLYDPTDGEILLNNINIKDISYGEYLDLFGCVFQDFKIYAFSIRDNISMFNEIDDNQIREILTKLKLDSLIDNLENKLDTNLFKTFDDNGIELSGGQNQKIAIARAMMKNAPFIVLDEPTAALDPRAEYDIFENFNNVSLGKTTVYISHRLSACKFSDRIIVFANGELAESGNHKELLEMKGLYSEMFNMQAQYYID